MVNQDEHKPPTETPTSSILRPLFLLRYHVANEATWLPCLKYQLVVWLTNVTARRFHRLFPSDQVCVYNDCLKRNKNRIKKGVKKGTEEIKKGKIKRDKEEKN